MSTVASSSTGEDRMAADLSATDYIDSDDPAIVAFAKAAVGDATDPVEKAIRLYYKTPRRHSLRPLRRKK